MNASAMHNAESIMHNRVWSSKKLFLALRASGIREGQAPPLHLRVIIMEGSE